MINTPSSTNSSSLDKSRANLVSLLWQTSGVFLIFLVMLVITAGKPSSWMLLITFLIAGGFVIWAEAKREQRFYQRKPATLQLSVPIDYLRSGRIKEWNQWRKHKTEKGVDLTEANLTRANLTRANLTRANLTEANLARANLMRADLTEANLTRANLTEANLTRANLTRADLTRTNLAGARRPDARSPGVSPPGANLPDARSPDGNQPRASLPEGSRPDGNQPDGS